MVVGVVILRHCRHYHLDFRYQDSTLRPIRQLRLLLDDRPVLPYFDCYTHFAILRIFDMSATHRSNGSKNLLLHVERSHQCAFLLRYSEDQTTIFVSYEGAFLPNACFEFDLRRQIACLVLCTQLCRQASRNASRIRFPSIRLS